MKQFCWIIFVFAAIFSFHKTISASPIPEYEGCYVLTAKDELIKLEPIKYHSSEVKTGEGFDIFSPGALIPFAYAHIGSIKKIPVFSKNDIKGFYWVGDKNKFSSIGHVSLLQDFLGESTMYNNAGPAKGDPSEYGEYVAFGYWGTSRESLKVKPINQFTIFLRTPSELDDYESTPNAKTISNLKKGEKESQVMVPTIGKVISTKDKIFYPYFSIEGIASALERMHKTHKYALNYKYYLKLLKKNISDDYSESSIKYNFILALVHADHRNFSEAKSIFETKILPNIKYVKNKDLKTNILNEYEKIKNSSADPCGAFIAPGVWKEFDCYNLAAIGKTTNDDPFTPSWRLIGGYWQWGRKGPSPSQWYDTNTEHFAHGPTGPGEDEANDGSISNWDDDDAPDGAWSDSYKTANDPCPAGFRIPTRSQWEGVDENNTQSIVGTWDEDDTNYSSGRFFGSNLLLPAAGRRYSGSGASGGRGGTGYYWSSSELSGSDCAWYLFFNSGGARVYGKYRRYGFSVRCVSE